jgi:hypothetical protein
MAREDGCPCTSYVSATWPTATPQLRPSSRTSRGPRVPFSCIFRGLQDSHRTVERWFGETHTGMTIPTRRNSSTARQLQWTSKTEWATSPWLSATRAEPSESCHGIGLGRIDVARRSARIAPGDFTQQDNQRTRRQYRQCDRRLPSPAPPPRFLLASPSHEGTAIATRFRAPDRRSWLKC